MIPQPYIMIPTAAVLAASALGLFLALRGRRRGDEPHCRRCGYNLTSLTSARCPECGADVSAARAVVIGRRERRWRLAAVSTVVLIISSTVSVAVLSGWASRYAWMQAAPYWWVRWRALGGHQAELTELDRRLARDELSPADRADAIESLLAAYHAGTPKMAREFARNLRAIDRGRGLTTEQRDQFFNDLTDVRTAVRSPIRLCDPLPFEFVPARELPEDWGNPGVMVERVRVNDRPWRTVSIVRRVKSGVTCLIFPESIFAEVVVVDDPGTIVGRNEITVEATVFVSDSHEGGFDPHRDWHLPERTFKARFDVLPAGHSDPLRLTSDAAVGSMLKAAFRKSQAEANKPLQDERGLCVWITTNPWPLPVDVAFSAIVRMPAGEIDVLRFAVAARSVPTSGLNFGSHSGMQLPESAGARLVLRSNPDLARRTVDIFMIWDGEIDLGPVKVIRESEKSSP